MSRGNRVGLPRSTRSSQARRHRFEGAGRFATRVGHPWTAAGLDRDARHSWQRPARRRSRRPRRRADAAIATPTHRSSRPVEAPRPEEASRLARRLAASASVKLAARPATRLPGCPDSRNLEDSCWPASHCESGPAVARRRSGWRNPIRRWRAKVACRRPATGSRLCKYRERFRTASNVAESCQAGAWRPARPFPQAHRSWFPAGSVAAATTTVRATRQGRPERWPGWLEGGVRAPVGSRPAHPRSTAPNATERRLAVCPSWLRSARNYPHLAALRAAVPHRSARTPRRSGLPGVEAERSCRVAP